WQARWQDGWYVTDDLFVRDQRGRFRFRGRADDVIVTAGYNVGPAEVESVLLEHPAVVEAAAPDPDRGAVVRAVVVRAPGAPGEEQLTGALQQAVRERIGRHAYPRVVDYIDALPRTATGKVRRTELRVPAPHDTVP
ncbi:MAG: AMP-binding enzyme, partial [Egibacteraceae bacterium]